MIEQSLRRVRSIGHRLFADHVATGIQRHLDQRRVGAWRSEHMNHIDRRRRQQRRGITRAFARVVMTTEELRERCRPIDDRDKLGAR